MNSHRQVGGRSNRKPSGQSQQVSPCAILEWLEERGTAAVAPAPASGAGQIFGSAVQQLLMEGSNRGSGAGVVTITQMLWYRQQRWQCCHTRMLDFARIKSGSDHEGVLRAHLVR